MSDGTNSPEIKSTTESTQKRFKQEDALQLPQIAEEVRNMTPEQIATRIQALNRQVERHKGHSAKDSLTKLFSRKTFEEILKKGFKESRRDPKTKKISLKLMDIDDFGKFNKKYGTNVGDQVLGLVGETINQNIREGDYAGRWGGEELVVYTEQPETREQPEERLRSAIEGIDLGEGINDKITVSIGTTESYEEDKYEDFFNRASSAVIVAKALGKNRIVNAEKTNFGTIYHDQNSGKKYTAVVSGKEIKSIQEIV